MVYLHISFILGPFVRWFVIHVTPEARCRKHINFGVIYLYNFIDNCSELSREIVTLRAMENRPVRLDREGGVGRLVELAQWTLKSLDDQVRVEVVKWCEVRELKRTVPLFLSPRA